MCYVLHDMYTITYSSIQYTVLVYTGTTVLCMHICIYVSLYSIPGTTPHGYGIYHICGVTGITYMVASSVDAYTIHLTCYHMLLGVGRNGIALDITNAAKHGTYQVPYWGALDVQSYHAI